MPKQVRSVVLCFVVALAMTIGSLLPDAAQSPSHDPFAVAAAEAARHALLSADVAGHGHAHDDGEPAERSAGHVHGHNPADHSHETPSTPPVVAALDAAVLRGWMPLSPASVPPIAGARLERPPRPSVIG